MLLSIFYFLLAGIAEIGGGYLVWLYMRDDKSPLYLLAGAIILILYGIIPTFQPEASFGKVYAAYGGVFIALSILWGWLIDGLRPDMYDIIGGLVCLVGVYIIMYAPTINFNTQYDINNYAESDTWCRFLYLYCTHLNL